MTNREDPRVVDYLYGELPEARAAELRRELDAAGEGEELDALAGVLEQMRELEEEEPAPHLDALILARAREAAESTALARREASPLARARKWLLSPWTGVAFAGAAALIAVIIIPFGAMQRSPELSMPPAMTPLGKAAVAPATPPSAAPVEDPAAGVAGGASASGLQGQPALPAAQPAQEALRTTTEDSVAHAAKLEGEGAEPASDVPARERASRRPAARPAPAKDQDRWQEPAEEAKKETLGRDLGRNDQLAGADKQAKAQETAQRGVALGARQAPVAAPAPAEPPPPPAPVRIAESKPAEAKAKAPATPPATTFGGASSASGRKGGGEGQAEAAGDEVATVERGAVAPADDREAEAPEVAEKTRGRADAPTSGVSSAEGAMYVAQDMIKSARAQQAMGDRVGARRILLHARDRVRAYPAYGTVTLELARLEASSRAPWQALRYAREAATVPGFAQRREALDLVTSLARELQSGADLDWAERERAR